MNDCTILIVDDEPELLELLYTIFEREGYTKILTADCGKTALKVWRKQPDFIIFGCNDAGYGRLSLKGNTETSSVPVLMLTARQEPV